MSCSSNLLQNDMIATQLANIGYHDCYTVRPRNNTRRFSLQWPLLLPAPVPGHTARPRHVMSTSAASSLSSSSSCFAITNNNHQQMLCLSLIVSSFFGMFQHAIICTALGSDLVLELLHCLVMESEAKHLVCAAFERSRMVPNGVSEERDRETKRRNISIHIKYTFGQSTSIYNCTNIHIISHN